jgi:predicted DNA-binding transcriptional regulator AlpA
MTRFLNRKDLKERRIPWGNAQLLRREAKGLFPRRVHLSQRVVVWNEDEIVEWEERRLADRDQAGAA